MSTELNEHLPVSADLAEISDRVTALEQAPSHGGNYDAQITALQTQIAANAAAIESLDPSLTTDPEGTYWAMQSSGAHGLYKSHNRIDWVQVCDLTEVGLAGRELDRSPWDVAGDTIVVGDVGAGIAVTHDAGVTWNYRKMSDLFPDDISSGRDVNGVATDGNGRWFIAMDGGFLLKSTDNGDTWTLLNDALVLDGGGVATNSLYGVSTDSKGTWFLAGYSGHNWVSYDNGNTWNYKQDLKVLLGSYTSREASTDGYGNWMLHVGAIGTFISRDNCATFTKTPATGSATHAVSTTIHQSGLITLVVGDGTFYVSRDFGERWYGKANLTTVVSGVFESSVGLRNGKTIFCDASGNLGLLSADGTEYKQYPLVLETGVYHLKFEETVTP